MANAAGAKGTAKGELRTGVSTPLVEFTCMTASFRVSSFVGWRKVPAVVLVESEPLVAIVSMNRLCFAESTDRRKLPLDTGVPLAPLPQPVQSKTTSKEVRLSAFAATTRGVLTALI
jgi:hypothetical protein